MQFNPVDDAGQGAPVDTAQPSRDLWTYADLGGFVLFSLGAQLACLIGAQGIAFAVIAVSGGTQRVDGEPVETLVFVASSVTSAIASLGYVYYVVAIKYRLPFWEALGFTPIRRRMYWFLLLGAVISVAEVMLGGLIGVPTDTPFAELLSNRATYLLMGAAAILIAPPLEEVLFRGFLYRPLERSGVRLARLS